MAHRVPGKLAKSHKARGWADFASLSPVLQAKSIAITNLNPIEAAAWAPSAKLQRKEGLLYLMSNNAPFLVFEKNQHYK